MKRIRKAGSSCRRDGVSDGYGGPDCPAGRASSDGRKAFRTDASQRD
jgi:hypothetical protein